MIKYKLWDINLAITFIVYIFLPLKLVESLSSSFYIWPSKIIDAFVYEVYNTIRRVIVLKLVEILYNLD